MVGRRRVQTTYGVDSVELPGWLKVVETVGVDILVDGQSNLDEEVHDHETLGANLEGQNLNGVGDEQTRPCKSVTGGEDPDHGNDSLTSGLAAVCLLLGRANSPNNEGNAHGRSGGDEKRAATDAVNEECAGNGDNERKDRKTTVDTKLGVAVGDANALVDVGSVVGGKTVSGPLGEETEGRKEHEPVPVALGLEEVEVRRVLLVHELKADSLLDLGKLKLNCGVVDVTVGVVLAEDVESLVVPVLGDQPTWRLWDEPDEGQLDNGWKSLGEGWNTPAPVAVDALSTEGQPGADDGTDVPETVVYSGDLGAMLRMAKLGEKQRR